MISFKWRHFKFKKDMILMLVRWYLAYSLSYRDVEELALERGLKVDHSTINRWVLEYVPQLEETFRKRYKRPVGISWHMDETYIKVKGQWVYLYRAVDKEGKTVDFLLSEKRDEPAARAFFEKAIDSNGLPEKVTMDKSGANKAGIDTINLHLALLFMLGRLFVQLTVRQIKYLNNIVEQDHRFIKKITKPMKGFKAFHSADATLAGIELHHMLRKEQHVDFYISALCCSKSAAVFGKPCFFKMVRYSSTDFGGFFNRNRVFLTAIKNEVSFRLLSCIKNRSGCCALTLYLISRWREIAS